MWKERADKTFLLAKACVLRPKLLCAQAIFISSNKRIFLDTDSEKSLVKNLLWNICIEFFHNNKISFNIFDNAYIKPGFADNLLNRLFQIYDLITKRNIVY